jgi:hypothetical protein
LYAGTMTENRTWSRGCSIPLLHPTTPRAVRTRPIWCEVSTTLYAKRPLVAEGLERTVIPKASGQIQLLNHIRDSHLGYAKSSSVRIG